MYWEHIEDFELSGFRFRLDVAPDSDTSAPWDHEDGHGDVRAASGYYGRPDKKPGERVLWRERGEYLFYDWQGAIQKARREGWGLSDESRARLAERLGRAPTAGEIRAEAVRQDFDYLRRWCAGYWCWILARVSLLDVEGEPVPEFVEYLGGIHSDSEDYVDECARALAAQIAAQVKERIGKKKHLVIEHPARVERIRLRA